MTRTLQKRESGLLMTVYVIIYAESDIIGFRRHPFSLRLDSRRDDHWYSGPRIPFEPQDRFDVSFMDLRHHHLMYQWVTNIYSNRKYAAIMITLIATLFVIGTMMITIPTARHLRLCLCHWSWCYVLCVSYYGATNGEINTSDWNIIPYTWGLHSIDCFFITRDSEVIMFSPCVFVSVGLSVYVCHDVCPGNLTLKDWCHTNHIL